MPSWKDVEDYPTEGPVDEQYVRDFIEWDTTTPGRKHLVERFARLKAIEDAGLKEYYRGLIQPRLDAIQQKLAERRVVWLASEEYQWLRSYLLSATNGSVEEIEELISPGYAEELRSPRTTREQYANWLWNTRHYFQATGDLDTVLELGAIAQKVEAEESGRQEHEQRP